MLKRDYLKAVFFFNSFLADLSEARGHTFSNELFLSVSLWMTTIASRDQLRPIGIRENFAVSYNKFLLHMGVCKVFKKFESAVTSNNFLHSNTQPAAITQTVNIQLKAKISHRRWNAPPKDQCSCLKVNSQSIGACRLGGLLTMIPRYFWLTIINSPKRIPALKFPRCPCSHRYSFLLFFLLQSKTF